MDWVQEFFPSRKEDSMIIYKDNHFQLKIHRSQLEAPESKKNKLDIEKVEASIRK